MAPTRSLALNGSEPLEQYQSACRRVATAASWTFAMLTLAQVWAILLLHVGTILVVTAYYAIAAAVWPRLTERAAARFAQRSWLAALVGVLISLPWVVVAIALMTVGGPIGGVGVVVGMGWIVAGLMGGAGIALHLGRAGDDRPASAATIRGGLILTLAWALPILGWFIVLPLSIATGVGCLVLGVPPLKTGGVEFSGAFAPRGGGAPGTPEAGLAFFHDSDR